MPSICCPLAPYRRTTPKVGVYFRSLRYVTWCDCQMSMHLITQVRSYVRLQFSFSTCFNITSLLVCEYVAAVVQFFVAEYQKNLQKKQMNFNTRPCLQKRIPYNPWSLHFGRRAARTKVDPRLLQNDSKNH